jgi:glycosyltransferase involved in cell wall biosynthesis
MVRLGAKPRFLNGLLTSGERPFSIIGVYRHLDGKVAGRVRSLRPDVVYAYEGGARETFREAKRLGIKTIYELTSSYWYWVRNLLTQEAERSPEFAGLLPNLVDSTRHLEWKDEELALADYIFVASEHVRRTLAGAVPEEKIRVVHYGAPAIRRRQRTATDPARPLRVLFVGALVQHKGIGYLLDAVDRLGSEVDLTLVGRRFQANPRVDDAVHRWRWFETLPHHRVMDVMMESDVLVLPSLGEGFGLVVTEALACGLPVIVTPNVGASDLVHDGQEGFVVPVGSADLIAERLHTLHGDRELLAAMSQKAQASAAEASWESYRSNFSETVEAIAACQ